MPVCKPEPQSQQGNFAVEVKTALLLLGLTVSELATRLNLSRNAVSRAINQPSDLPTVKRAIRKELAL